MAMNVERNHSVLVTVPNATLTLEYIMNPKLRNAAHDFLKKKITEHYATFLPCKAWVIFRHRHLQQTSQLTAHRSLCLSMYLSNRFHNDCPGVYLHIQTTGIPVFVYTTSESVGYFDVHHFIVSVHISTHIYLTVDISIHPPLLSPFWKTKRHRPKRIVYLPNNPV